MPTRIQEQHTSLCYHDAASESSRHDYNHGDQMKIEIIYCPT